MTSSRSLHVLLVAALVGVLALAAPDFSSASFTARTQATAQVRAAADWTPPTVAVASPGTPVKDVVTVSVTATDGETGVAGVTLEQLAPAGSSWVSVCTDSTAPYTCSWDTRPLADGQYSLRARATDGAGYETTSEVVRTTVANKLLVVLAEPAPAVRGTVPLSASVYNVGALTHTVRIEYAASGTTGWRSICSNLTSPYTCSWATAGLASGDYDLRAVLVTGSTLTYSAVVDAITVDNTAPSATMVDPGSPLSGTRTFTADATDAHTGVDRVVVQYARTGTTSWLDLCTLTEEPWTCRAATSVLPDGSYGFRAVAVDDAGNTGTSAVVTDRLVDNTVSAVSVNVPTRLTGTVTVGATVSSTAQVASVQIQIAPVGGSTWSDLCTDGTAPYSCSWDTSTVPDGLYDFRAVLVDTLGRTTVSAVESAHRVDNSPLRGLDVQSSNGGGSLARVDAGDALTLTYSGEVDLTRVAAGWNGEARPVTVRLRDGVLMSRSGRDDTLDVLSNGVAVNLGSVNLKQDYVKNQRVVQFNATLTATTVTAADGTVRTTVTLRLGPVAQGASGLRTVSTAGTMVWAPSAAVTDLQGRSCSPAPVTETGVLDREF